MFRLAHVTDPHFRSFTGAHVSDFFGKRAIGALNLVVNRARKHRMELLADMSVDLRGRAVDHLALTGDLSNVSLASEWEAAKRWLAALGSSASDVTIIPGNHDAYVADVVESGIFESLFAGFQSAEVRPGPETYPFARLRGDVAIVGITTCVATGDLGAWGEIGVAQLGRLERLLQAPELAGKIRVLLMHHPPVLHRPPEARNLRDREALVALLARTGVELVLHGHDHRDEQTTLRGPGGVPIPVVGAGSASYAGSAARRSRYNIYELEIGRITAVTYAHDEASDRFAEVRREILVGA